MDLIPRQCVTYFCPGHLRKYPENSCKAITYLTFSPDGRELLVNMGAEQIYLYDLDKGKEPNWLQLPPAAALQRHHEHRGGSGGGGSGGSGSSSRRSGHYSTEMDHRSGSGSGSSSRRRTSGSSSSSSSRRKESMCEFFDFDLGPSDSHRTSRALITKLTKQIHASPNDPELLYRRASHYLMRGYYGDSYAALRDFNASLHLDPTNVIGYYRLAQCLFKLHYFGEAFECLQELKARFPTCIDPIDINNFEKRINDHFKVRWMTVIGPIGGTGTFSFY